MSRVGESRVCPFCHDPHFAGVCVGCGFCEPDENEPVAERLDSFRPNQTQRSLAHHYDVRRK